MTLFRNLLIASTLAIATLSSALAGDKVDINRASATQLADSLNGVGAAKAEAIIEYRTKNGPFQSADQLAEVRGIGLKTIEKNRDVILVGSAAKPATPKPEAAK